MLGKESQILSRENSQEVPRAKVDRLLAIKSNLLVPPEGAGSTSIKDCVRLNREDVIMTEDEFEKEITLLRNEVLALPPINKWLLVFLTFVLTMVFTLFWLASRNAWVIALVPLAVVIILLSYIITLKMELRKKWVKIEESINHAGDFA